ncbi:AbrB family transcriptional regulator [Duganella sp. BJB488]|uniref:AbrB family transcriptional regulator n=1 Tax=Duganella vulcania TaxID=2692166 RepID=A0A845G281_9BURK|nr:MULTISPECIES: AbrB/MazE/SpoVT family DNA-binding domain-containing protein [Duganella]MYM86858.1 AbrB family transcriptional regulator [Duganella vulcania]NVD74084.1 AbrB family transcriptional regulator [Duganella sp. BJB1802]RFP16943.1 AbrB family transcriptional regulator [Duganella sp. BJB489]RFP20637.1 AbrB family transcriptional regulator [Duganella sp. BJB488]RFP32309.1 AbrB family transcriptional regulator [Duganella sp. BJB480]
MTIAFLAPDGTVTVPRSVRKALGLENGGRIEFLPFGDGQVVMIAMNLSPKMMEGILPKPDLDCSVEEMIEIAAKRAALASK